MLCITMNDGNEIRWSVGEPLPKRRFNRPDTFPIEIIVYSEAELQHIFDVLNLSEIERRVYYNLHGTMQWSDPIAIRGITAALFGRENR